jgi:hypothetical protein
MNTLLISSLYKDMVDIVSDCHKLNGLTTIEESNSIVEKIRGSISAMKGNVGNGSIPSMLQDYYKDFSSAVIDFLNLAVMRSNGNTTIEEDASYQEKYLFIETLQKSIAYMQEQMNKMTVEESNMEHIQDMEYSLHTIKYLFELQIKEQWEATSIHINEPYPFCNGVAYKQSVMGYMVTNGGTTINRIVSNHISLCKKIIELWNEQLSNMPSPLPKGLNKEELQSELENRRNREYHIYCMLSKNMSYPFSDLSLIKKNNGIYEQGNPFLDDNRYWMEYQPQQYIYKGLSSIKTRFELDNRIIIKTKMYMPSTMAAFVDNVLQFLSEWEQSQQAPKEPSFTLPNELDTEEARAYFQKAIEVGLMNDITSTGYEWNDTKQLLAYFAEQLSKKLRLSDKQDKGGNTMINWKVFEIAFNVPNLKQGKFDWMKLYTTFTPKGYEKIDAIMSDI